jgi:hypothetical protein
MSDSIHDLLLKEFRAYFEDHQNWEATQSHASGIRMRQHLSRIRKLCSQRRVEIQAIRETKPKIKSPVYRQSLFKAKGNDKT